MKDLEYANKTPYISRRNAEQRIHKAFINSSKSNCQLLAISGIAGIGKTHMIQNTIESLVTNQTYYASVKVNQSDKALDYDSICKLLNQLVQYQLTEDKQSVAKFKATLNQLEAEEIDLLYKTLPDLKYIFDSNNLISHWDPKKLNKKVKTALVRFLNILSKDHRHIVLFVDDLQWMDPRSFETLQMIVDLLQNNALFIICAYRDDKITHLPCNDKLSEWIISYGSNFQLKAFDLAMTNHYVSQYLNCDPTDTFELSKQIQLRTLGVPLNILQLIITLKKQTPNASINLSHYLESLKQLDNKSLSIVEKRLFQLPKDTIEVLKVAACIGYHFDYDLLMTVGSFKASNIKYVLNLLCSQSIIIASPCRKYTNENVTYASIATQYEFYHDTIFNTVYQLMSPEIRQNLHLVIARKLVAKHDKLCQKKCLNAIVKHYNLATKKMIGKTEKQSVIHYTFCAAERAKSVAAYTIALEFYNYALSLMSNDHWLTAYNITYQIHSGIVDCYSYLNYDLALRHIKKLFVKTNHKKQEIELHYKAMLIYTYQGQYKNTLIEGKKALRLLGITLPSQNYNLYTLKEILHALLIFNHSKVKHIFTHNQTIDHYSRTCIDILNLMSSAANLVDEKLVVLILLKLANFSAKRGISLKSHVGYASYCVVLANILGKFYRASLISNKIHEALKNTYEYDIKCKTEFILACFVDYYHQPLSTTINQLKAVFKMGVNHDEHLFGLYSLAVLLEQSYSRGLSLSTLLKQCNDNKKFTQLKSVETVNRSILMIEKVIENLSGEDDKNDFYHSNLTFEKKLLDEKTNDIVNFYLYQAQCALHFENINQARNSIDHAMFYLKKAKGYFFYTEVFYYYFLIYTSVFKTLGTIAKIRIWFKLRNIIVKYNKWASLCPQNFSHKRDLLIAEYTSLFKRHLKAIHYYDLAMTNAKKNNYHQDAALASHFTANYYLKNNSQDISSLYRHRTYENYMQWGAYNVCKYYKQEYALNVNSEKNDSILKAKVDNKPIISKESDNCFATFFSKLSVQKDDTHVLLYLLECICKLANANKGYIFIEQEDTLYLKMQYPYQEPASLTNDEIPLDALSDIPKKMLRFTMRTYQVANIDQKQDNKPFKRDIYVKKNNFAMASYPLFLNRVFLGVLYIENKVSSSPFSDKITLYIQSLSQHLHYVTKMKKNITQEIDSIAMHTTQSLSQRELEVLDLIAKGKTGKEIAAVLKITLSTVKAHTKSIYRKLGVKRRVQAVIIAKEKKLINPCTH